MTAIYAIAMGALALAPLLAFSVPGPVGQRAGSLCSAAGSVLLVIVGIAAAIGDVTPVLSFGGWLGFGHSALRDDGLAGIFLALTGLTGAGAPWLDSKTPR